MTLSISAIGQLLPYHPRVKTILTLALIVLASLAAVGQDKAKSDDDDCTLNRVDAILEDSADFKVERKRQSERELTERARLSPTVTVEVMQGGCADYGVQVRVTTIGSASRRQVLLDEAFTFLKLLKPHTGSDSAISAIVEMIAARKGRPYQNGDVIQDSKHPDVTVDVTRQDGEVHELVIVYSYAL